jgi:hypothetical protein
MRYGSVCERSMASRPTTPDGPRAKHLRAARLGAWRVGCRSQAGRALRRSSYAACHETRSAIGIAAVAIAVGVVVGIADGIVDDSEKRQDQIA